MNCDISCFSYAENITERKVINTTDSVISNKTLKLTYKLVTKLEFAIASFNNNNTLKLKSAITLEP
jgi:hypothetical protein